MYLSDCFMWINSWMSWIRLLSQMALFGGLVVLVYYLFRRYFHLKSLREEFWLPVIDDMGNVLGRVARSVSIETPGRYQHLMIRILVYKSGTIYLLPKENCFCEEPGLYDLPFERLMRYGEAVEEVLDFYKRTFFPKTQSLHFMLKYKHHNECGRFQVLLYMLAINDDSELVGLGKGKFWTLQQIQENVGQHCFSSQIQGEYDFLKIMVGN
jgi:hypothetical protein